MSCHHVPNFVLKILVGVPLARVYNLLFFSSIFLGTVCNPYMVLGSSH